MAGTFGSRLTPESDGNPCGSLDPRSEDRITGLALEWEGHSIASGQYRRQPVARGGGLR